MIQTHPYAKKDCQKCFGSGKVRILVKNGPPKEKMCECTLTKRLLANADRGWAGISKAPVVKSSQLMDYKDKSLWVTAEPNYMKANLRHIAIRQPLSWRFMVVTDKELMAAWLATAALAGVDLFDKEAYEISANKFSIEDLIQPYDLVVIRLGVKNARNSAMAEVLLEALALRQHLEKPVWVWDQPSRPLTEGHLCWSMAVRLELAKWQHLKVVRGNQSTTNPTPTKKRTKTRSAPVIRSLSQTIKRS